eukprot:GDKJ01026659.1.p1 GENE.GDKJ01026659.1~~GDKJ01026659.1.p1  ORF type:complete len:515 (+),score=98.18 GDKJ01026659.1:2-1546(+)
MLRSLVSVTFALSHAVKNDESVPIRPTFSGYVPVDASKGSKLWYAYFEKDFQENSEPVLLWLNGGPGCSSSKGVMVELGPVLLNENAPVSVRENPYSYHKFANLLTFDQPIGSGLSVAGSDNLRRSLWETTIDLYLGLVDVYAKNPKIRDKPLVISGESYAGKYIPGLSHLYFQLTHPDVARHAIPGQPLNPGGYPILPDNLPKPNFVLKGQAIGNGLIEPCVQLETYISTTEALGLLPLSVAEDAKRWAAECFDHRYSVEDLERFHTKRNEFEKVIEQECGVPTVLNFTRSGKYDRNKMGEAFYNQEAVRAAFNAVPVSEHKYIACNYDVSKMMSNDIMTSTAEILIEVVDHSDIKTLLFNGALDIKDGPLGHMKWMEKFSYKSDKLTELIERKMPVQWRHGREAQFTKNLLNSANVGIRVFNNRGTDFSVVPNAESSKTLVDEETGGLWFASDDLSLVMANVNNAGHMVPVEEPRGASALLGWFVEHAVYTNPYQMNDADDASAEGLQIHRF